MASCQQRPSVLKVVHHWFRASPLCHASTSVSLLYSFRCYIIECSLPSPLLFLPGQLSTPFSYYMTPDSAKKMCILMHNHFVICASPIQPQPMQYATSLSPSCSCNHAKLLLLQCKFFPEALSCFQVSTSRNSCLLLGKAQLGALRTGLQAKQISLKS